MTVDIRGVNTHNKGAELMLIAIARELGDGFDLSASPNGTAYDVRARLGLRQTMLINQAPRASAAASNMIPGALKKAFGLTSDSDISGVLDAAGFAYSDSFSSERSRRESIHAKRWSSHDIPIVFLPQAFGPFDNVDQRKWSSALLSRARRVYARDAVSLEHVRGLGRDIPVELAPDFTIGLEVPATASPAKGPFAAIVPNSKMISHTNLDRAEYVRELVTAGDVFKVAGLEPLVVLHEFSDRAIATAVASELGCGIYSDPSPLRLKAILGMAEVAIASRFHAIVGALSQDTPVLAFGWSHKYVELLNDFGVPQWILAPGGDIRKRTEDLLADVDGAVTVAARGVGLKARTREMWRAVSETLDGAATRA